MEENDKTENREPPVPADDTVVPADDAAAPAEDAAIPSGTDAGATDAQPQANEPNQDQVLELSFVPDWAKKPPAGVDFYTSGRGGRRDHDYRDDGRDRRGRPDRDRGRPGQFRGGPRPDRGGGRRDDRRGPDRERPQQYRDDERRRRPEPVRPAPVQVRFMPEQRRLSAVMRKIQLSKQSYPLVELAALFLSRPETCEVRLELEGGTPSHLYQCKLCRMVSTDQSLLAAHVANRHLADFFQVEEKVSDPPAGQFTCVAKCGLSGVLLGPPNHHSYNEKVREIHHTRYPDMPIEVYRNRIQVVHDPALIEQWKEESRKQTLYRRKQANGEPGAPVGFVDAEAAMVKEVVPTVVQEAKHVVVLSAAVARDIEDQSLMLSVRDAWQKENRFPYTLSMAFRGAFRSRHLFVFKAGRGIDFVSAVLPTPLDPEHAVEPIRKVLMHLREHPGCTRKELVDVLLPGLAVDSAEVRGVLTSLAWLIERGHIIEFFNGTLSVPLKDLRHSPARGKPHAAKP